MHRRNRIKPLLVAVVLYTASLPAYGQESGEAVRSYVGGGLIVAEFAGGFDGETVLNVGAQYFAVPQLAFPMLAVTAEYGVKLTSDLYSDATVLVTRQGATAAGVEAQSNLFGLQWDFGYAVADTPEFLIVPVVGLAVHWWNLPDGATFGLNPRPANWILSGLRVGGHVSWFFTERFGVRLRTTWQISTAVEVNNRRFADSRPRTSLATFPTGISLIYRPMRE
jgi:hypothetical protein